jgi:hypothetical protein
MASRPKKSKAKRTTTAVSEATAESEAATAVSETTTNISEAATDVSEVSEATTDATDDITFDVAVTDGKEIVEREGRDQMRLGELADRLETKYGEGTLKKFADAIGVAQCTVKRRRSVWRAWKGAPAPHSISYAVAQELEAHPDRVAIVAENPKLTRAAARRLKQEHKGTAKPKTELMDEWQEDTDGWFRDVVRLANKAVDLAKGADEQTMSPELRRRLRQAIEPKLVEEVSAGGEALKKLAEFLQRLANETDEAEEPSEPQAANDAQVTAEAA